MRPRPEIGAAENSYDRTMSSRQPIQGWEGALAPGPAVGADELTRSYAQNIHRAPPVNSWETRFGLDELTRPWNLNVLNPPRHSWQPEFGADEFSAAPPPSKTTVDTTQERWTMFAYGSAFGLILGALGMHLFMSRAS